MNFEPEHLPKIPRDDENDYQHNYSSCRLLWVQALRVYISDCRTVWLRPEDPHDEEVLSAINDMLSKDTPQLKFICDHLHHDIDPHRIKKAFLQWIRNQ